jgi:ketosteroid isomerase-like protein
LSQENVEIVRAAYEEFAKGNLGGSLGLYDPLILFIPITDFPAADHYLGPDGLSAFMREYLNAWESFTMTAEELIEAESSVLVAVRQRALGRESRVPSEIRYFEVWTFRGRSVIRIEQFRERADALNAAGLAEQDAHPDS